MSGFKRKWWIEGNYPKKKTNADPNEKSYDMWGKIKKNYNHFLCIIAINWQLLECSYVKQYF